MEGETFTPVSILKKTRVNEAINNDVKRERRAVVIVEEDGGDIPIRVVSDPDSEDSALCLKGEDTNSETSDSAPILDHVDHAPAPGRHHRSDSDCIGMKLTVGNQLEND